MTFAAQAYAFQQRHARQVARVGEGQHAVHAQLGKAVAEQTPQRSLRVALPLPAWGQRDAQLAKPGLVGVAV